MEEDDEVFILLKDKEGERISNVVMGTLFGAPPCNVLRGELAVKIPEKSRNDGKPPHNYQTVYTDQPPATFYDSNDESDIAPLFGEQHLLLAGVKSKVERYHLFLNESVDWGITLKINNPVQVSLNNLQPADTEVIPKATAVIQYVGPVKGEVGIMFGIEIVDPHFFGQGTTDGTFRDERYFICNDFNGMFVSFDKLSKLPPGGHVHDRPPNPQSRQQPTSQSGGKDKDKKKWKNYRFKVSDRVVAFKKNGDVIHGTVRWVGKYSLQDVKKQHFSVAAVGIETDKTVLGTDMESCLPAKHHYFSVGKLRSSLFIREEEVLLEEDFATLQQQKDVRKQSKQSSKQTPATQQYSEWKNVEAVASNEPLNVNDPSKLAQQLGVNQTQFMKEQSDLLQRAAKEKEREDIKAAIPDESLNMKGQERMFQQYLEQKRKEDKRKISDSASTRRETDHIYDDLPPQPPRQALHDPEHHSNHGQHPTLLGQYIPYIRPPDQTFSAGLGVGSPVQLIQDPNRTGVIKWIGPLPEIKGTIAGVELDGPMEGCGDGVWRGHRYFTCTLERAFFCPVTSLRPCIPQPSYLQPMDNMQAQLTKAEEREKALEEQVCQMMVEKQQQIEELQQEKESCQQLRHQLQQEQQRYSDMEQQLMQEQHSKRQLQYHLQQEQQRNSDLQDRLDKQHIHPVTTAVVMNTDFHRAERSEVRTGAIIGEGAWGKVEKGVYKGSTVAVKSIHIAIFEQNTVDRLRREMTIMSQVRHPNLVRFIAAVLDRPVEQLQSPPMIITELLDINLREAYKQRRVVPGHHLSILHNIAYGLHYLHSLQQPIIHRDISAPNVLLQQQPNGTWLAKVSDFGSANFARLARTAGEGAIIYSAPETFPSTASDASQTASLLTTKVDVFSYGIVACELVVGEMPSSERYRAMLRQVKNKWAYMYGLIERCTKHNPHHRPTMADILDELPQPTRSQ